MKLPFPIRDFRIDKNFQSIVQNINTIQNTLVDLQNLPKAKAYLTADQLNIQNSIWTLVQFDEKDYDPWGIFKASSNGFVLLNNGFHRIEGQIAWKNIVANKSYRARIFVNGTVRATFSIHASEANWLSVPFFDTFQALKGNLLQIKCFNNSGVDTCDVYGGDPQFTFVSISYLGS